MKRCPSRERAKLLDNNARGSKLDRGINVS